MALTKALATKEITIRTAEIADIETAIEILNNGFYNDSIPTWLVSDVEERPKILGDYFRLHLRLGIQKGFVDLAVTPEFGVSGVAIWLPHDASDENVGNELMRIAGDYAPRFDQFGGMLHSNLPPVQPYFQLMITAIRPSAHGLGIGSRLIAHRLHVFDRMGMPTYLESTTRLAAGGVYERLGYQPVGEPLRIPDGAIEVFPMWRFAHEPNSFIPPNHGSDDKEAHDSIIFFGGYNWRVLDIKDGAALISSDKTIGKQKYHQQYEATTWANCDLRHYLNDTFFNSFNESERLQILESRLPNINNPWFGTNGGRDTTDKIFLLSIDEVTKYLGDSGQLQNRNPYTKYFINDNFNNVRKTVDMENVPSCWWLRSSGNNPAFASSVSVDGRITVSGDFVTRDGGSSGGIRPALWLKL